MSFDKPRKILVLDLDDTLYPISSGLRGKVLDRIVAFVTGLGIQAEDPIAFCYSLYYEHGSTFLGLRKLGHPVGAVEFYEFVNDVDPANSTLTEDDTDLQDLLTRFRTEIGFEKIFLLTNSERKHARRICDFLNVWTHFDDSCCMEDFAEFPNGGPLADPLSYGLVNKPMKQSFEIFIEKVGICPGDEVVFVEDSASNLQASLEFGWRGFLLDELESLSIKEGDSEEEVETKKKKVQGVTVVKTLSEVAAVLLEDSN